MERCGVSKPGPGAGHEHEKGVSSMSEDVTAPMSGTIMTIVVQLGDEVKEEDELVILEAVKMEIPVYAPADGKVAAIKVAVGDEIETNQVLMVLE